MTARASGIAAVVVAAFGLAAAFSSGCLGDAEFRCQDHAQCGTGNFCELDGHCSVYDPACAGQRRYVNRAGAVSGSCVARACDSDPITAISAGGSHACVVRTGGSVWCWGKNDRGQLGDGSRTPRSTAVQVRGLPGPASTVATGNRHTCAVISPGALFCWGANDRGQLGNGGGADSAVPVPVPGAAGAGSVAAGADFSCAAIVGGSAVCWGDDSAGQIGDGVATAPSALPSAVSGLSTIRSISASGQHACAVTNAGQLFCWGNNSQGQLGIGTLINQPSPTAVPGLSGVRAVTTGPNHTCASTAADVRCWGSNAANQLSGSTTGPVTTPAQVGLVMDPIAIGAGARHSCAIQMGGGVLCWGSNDRGQVGGAASGVLLPEPVVGVGKATALGVGDDFSCVLAEDDAVFCWGDNRHGQLGIGSGTIRLRPAQVPGIEGALLLAAGGAHTCAVTQTGSAPSATRTLSCWGANEVGQLGDGETIDRAFPAATRIPELQAATISAGAASTCAVVSNSGRLACWGDATDRPYPTTVDLPDDGQAAANGSNAQRLAMGGAHGCLLSMGSPMSRLLCFGANNDGQLGDGTIVSRKGPEPVTWTAGVAPKSVTSGGAHSCAIAIDDSLWCWGRGDEGQIGDGGTTGRTAPVAISFGGSIRATAVAAGGAHTCALVNEGTVRCWGRSQEGQTATVQVLPLPTPIPVLVVGGATGVAAGDLHTCVITSDKHVRCWGGNDYGQLGDGTIGGRSTPFEIEGLTDVEEIAAGGAHTCARVANGTVFCWGANTSGQLGDGVVLTMRSPTLARLTCN